MFFVRLELVVGPWRISTTAAYVRGHRKYASMSVALWATNRWHAQAAGGRWERQQQPCRFSAMAARVRGQRRRSVPKSLTARAARRWQRRVQAVGGGRCLRHSFRRQQWPQRPAAMATRVCGWQLQVDSTTIVAACAGDSSLGGLRQRKCTCLGDGNDMTQRR